MMAPIYIMGMETIVEYFLWYWLEVERMQGLQRPYAISNCKSFSANKRPFLATTLCT